MRHLALCQSPLVHLKLLNFILIILLTELLSPHITFSLGQKVCLDNQNTKNNTNKNNKTPPEHRLFRCLYITLGSIKTCLKATCSMQLSTCEKSPHRANIKPWDLRIKEDTGSNKCLVYSETANLSVQPRAGDIFLPFSDQISDVLLLHSHRWSLSEAAGIPKLRLEGGGEWGFYIFPSFSSAHHKHTHTDTHILQKGGLCFSSISCEFYFQTETFERQKVKRGQQIED